MSSQHQHLSAALSVGPISSSSVPLSVECLRRSQWILPAACLTVGFTKNLKVSVRSLVSNSSENQIPQRHSFIISREAEPSRIAENSFPARQCSVMSDARRMRKSSPGNRKHTLPKQSFRRNHTKGLGCEKQGSDVRREERG